MLCLFVFVFLNLYILIYMGVYLCLKQLTPIEKYALHYLEYLHISDDESALKVTEIVTYLNIVLCM